MLSARTISAHSLLRHSICPRLFRCCTQSRAVSSAVTPVELRYDKVVPPDGNETDKPLVILHGLLCVRYLFLLLSANRSVAGRDGTGDPSPKHSSRTSGDRSMLLYVPSWLPHRQYASSESDRTFATTEHPLMPNHTHTQPWPPMSCTFSKRTN